MYKRQVCFNPDTESKHVYTTANGLLSNQFNFQSGYIDKKDVYKRQAYMDVADDGYYWERIRAKSYYNNLWTPDQTNGTCLLYTSAPFVMCR